MCWTAKNSASRHLRARAHGCLPVNGKAAYFLVTRWQLRLAGLNLAQARLGHARAGPGRLPHAEGFRARRNPTGESRPHFRARRPDTGPMPRDCGRDMALDLSASAETDLLCHW